MKRLHTIWISAYACLCAVGAVAQVLDAAWAKFVFAAGAALAIAQTFVYAMQNKSEDITVARQQRLMFIASLFLGIAAWMMFTNDNAWIVMALCYAVIALYLSFRQK